jgi:outer membrane protein assembly factor BamB
MNLPSVRLAGFRALLPLLLMLPSSHAPAYDWLQYNGDPQHSGNNTLETIITSSNVNNLAFTFQAALPAVADGAPVYLSGVDTPSGVRDLLFVTTKAGHIVVLDAHTGIQIWVHQYPAGSCRINLGSSLCYTTSSPAIDPNRRYIYSYGLDGSVHKYQVGDGTEITSGGWPELATLKGFNEKGSSALAVATSSGGATYLYVTNGGYPGDAGDYQGHVTAINLADGTQHVFNALCSDQTVHFLQNPGLPDCLQHVQSAIWARVAVVYDNVTNHIYMATGNGDYDGNIGGHEWGDTVFSLNPDGTGSAGEPLDTYTPTNFQQLQNADADLGSTAPAILPATGYSGRLAVQSGKDANLRLINLMNLSGQGGPGHVGGEIQILPVPQGGVVLSAPAVWISPADGSTWVFVANANGISGFRVSVTAGVPTLVLQWQKAGGGFSPIIANNVLYYAGSGIIRALDPFTGNLLWSDTTHVGGNHWESPVIANGTLYITDESSHLTAYSFQPIVLSLTPLWGPTAGGTAVTIFGFNFRPGAAMSFGGVAATGTTVVNPSTITATTPAHSAAAVDVSVTNTGGFTATLAHDFSYNGGIPLFTVAPCRVLDTRHAPGAYGGPALAAQADRSFILTGQCGIPASARAVAVNLTVTGPTAAGDLRFYSEGPLPPTSTINYRAGQTRANNAVVSLSAGGAFTVHCDQSSGTVDLILDVSGYFP